MITGINRNDYFFMMKGKPMKITSMKLALIGLLSLIVACNTPKTKEQPQQPVPKQFSDGSPKLPGEIELNLQSIPDIDTSMIADKEIKNEIEKWQSVQFQQEHRDLDYSTRQAAFQISKTFKEKYPQTFDPLLGYIETFELAASTSAYGTKEDIRKEFQEKGYDSMDDYLKASEFARAIICKSLLYLNDMSRQKLWVKCFAEIVSQYAGTRVSAVRFSDDGPSFSVIIKSEKRSQKVIVTPGRYPTIDAERHEEIKTQE